MKSKNLADSFRHAWDGVRQTALRERNFKIHIVMGILAVAFCIVLRVDFILFVMVVYAIFSVLCMELVNTAVEAVTDLSCGGKRHPLAKLAKDAAAGAVLLSALQALVVAGAVVLSIWDRYNG